MIAAQDIRVWLGGRPVLDGVSLGLRAGEFAVLAGPNGAGKSTLLSVLAGLRRADEGQVRAPHPRARKVAWLAQGAASAWNLAVAELVALGRIPHGGADPDGQVQYALAACGIAHLADRALSDISGGEQRRAQLARALATDAEVLLLDEPTAALDPAQGFAVLALLRREADAGRAVLAVLHAPETAAAYAHRLLVLHDGKLVADGRPDAVLDQAARAYGVRLGQAPAMLPPSLMRWMIALAALLHAAVLAALVAWPHPPRTEPDELPGLEVMLGSTQAPGAAAPPPAPPPAPAPTPPAEPVPVEQEVAAAPPDPPPDPPPAPPVVPQSPAPQPPAPEPIAPAPEADPVLPLPAEPTPPPAAPPPEPPPRPLPAPPRVPPPEPPPPPPAPPIPPVVRSPLGQELAALLPDDPGTQTEGELIPARPVPGARNAPPVYPPAAYQRGQQGAVTVRLRVDADGSVLRVELVESSGYPLLDNAVLDALRRWRFAPAMKDGVPVAADSLHRTVFRLD